MRQILLGITFFSCILIAYSFSSKGENPTTIAGKNVKWMTWEEAIEAAEDDKSAGKKPKKIFIDIYTDWCGWCKKMDAETFEQADIAAYLNKNFYPVKFNAEQKEPITFDNKTFKYVPSGNRGYHELAAALLAGKMSYPTVVFLNEEFQLLQRIPGYLDIPTFDMIAHYLAEDHFTKTPWADFQQKYQEQKKQNPSAKNK